MLDFLWEQQDLQQQQTKSESTLDRSQGGLAQKTHSEDSVEAAGTL